MSGVKFESATFIYDGTVKTLTVKGTLPAGMTVSYENNGKSQVGIYSVVAKFDGHNSNYNNPSNMTANLTIKSSGYGPSGGGSSVNRGPAAYTEPTANATPVKGNWAKTGDVWTFTSGGTQLKNGWFYVVNPYSTTQSAGWFFFDENGIMKTGWILSRLGHWYYCHDVEDGDLGRMETGWHVDSQDGLTYYLDPVTGQMLTGWQTIDGKSYYFTEMSQQSTWVLDGHGKWVATAAVGKPLGSMDAAVR